MMECLLKRLPLAMVVVCLVLPGGGGSAVAHEVEDGGIHVPLRGDVTGDDRLNLTDAVSLLDFLFGGGTEPACLAVANADAQDAVNLTDAVFILQFLFGGGPKPAPLTDEEIRGCQARLELSFSSIYEKILARSCAFSSCHSAESHKGQLSFATLEAAYDGLVGVEPFNLVARDSGMLRVAPGVPEASFLLKKLMQPGPGEGTRMPANSPVPLSDATIAAFREWILAGAPREGTIEGVPDITDEPPPPIDRMPEPPQPENGVQLHLAPYAVGPHREREIFFFVERPFAGLDVDEIHVQRIDVFMMEQSHHFVLYEHLGSTRPRAGIRPIESVLDLFNQRRVQVISQQSFFTLSFPEGVGLRFNKNASFDLNSHYVNLNGEQTLMAEAYVNIYFAAPGSVKTVVKPLFEVNPNINVPPNQTRTIKAVFPGPTMEVFDRALGSRGRVRSETHIYALTSHMHRHGVRFSAYRLENGRELDPRVMVYDSHDWDDPVYEIFDPPLVLSPGQGFRFEATHTYHDPPRPNAPPLTFNITSEDEMAILLGYYSIP